MPGAHPASQRAALPGRRPRRRGWESWPARRSGPGASHRNRPARRVDAHHLVGGIVVPQAHRRPEDAVEHLALDAVEILILDAQVRLREAPNPAFAVPVEALLRHAVGTVDLPGHVAPARGPHAVLQTELRAVPAHPVAPLLGLGNVGHAVLQVGTRFVGKQVLGQPRQVDVAVRRNDTVVHGLLPRRR